MSIWQYRRHVLGKNFKDGAKLSGMKSQRCQAWYMGLGLSIHPLPNLGLLRNMLSGGWSRTSCFYLQSTFLVYWNINTLKRRFQHPPQRTLRHASTKKKNDFQIGTTSALIATSFIQTRHQARTYRATLRTCFLVSTPGPWHKHRPGLQIRRAVFLRVSYLLLPKYTCSVFSLFSHLSEKSVNLPGLAVFSVCWQRKRTWRSIGIEIPGKGHVPICMLYDCKKTP